MCRRGAALGRSVRASLVIVAAPAAGRPVGAAAVRRSRAARAVPLARPATPGQHGGAKGATARSPSRAARARSSRSPRRSSSRRRRSSPRRGGLTLPAGTRRSRSRSSRSGRGRPDRRPHRRQRLPDHRDRPAWDADHGPGVSARQRRPAGGRSDPVEATIARFADGAWQPIKTSSAGFGATFLAVVTEFGDFAVVAPGAAASASSSPASTGSPIESTSAVAVTTPGASPTPNASNAPATTDSSPPGWLLPVLAVGALGVMIVGYRAARRGRSKGW